MKKTIVNFFQEKKTEIAKLLFVVVFAVIFAVVLNLALNMVRISGSNYADYTKSNKPYTISEKEEWIFDKDCFLYFETECIGNRQSILMKYGQYYADDTMEVIGYTAPSTLNINDKNVELLDHEISYINVIEDYIYYRDELDRKIYSYSIDTGEIAKLSDIEVGEMVVSTKGLSYISLIDEKLYFQEFGKSKAKMVIEENVKKFTQIGDKYLCLLDDARLVLCDFNSIETIEEKTDNYLYQGYLLVQKGEQIYQYDTFHHYKELDLGNRSYLLTVDQSSIYYVDLMEELQKIYQYDIETKERKLIKGVEEPSQVIKFYYAIGKDEKDHILKILNATSESKEEPKVE